MLTQFVNWLIYDLCGLMPETKLGLAAHFFVYDSIKIIVLLFVMITVIGVIRTFIPQEKIKEWMGQRGIAGNFFAALFGAITPFCSCSGIPIFFGFLKAGIPLGVAFSFLITSPLVNEYLVVLMLGFFGWKITLLYVLSGMLLGIVGGLVLGRMKLEKYLAADLVEGKKISIEGSGASFVSRLKFGVHEAVEIIQKTWAWMLVGVGVGALIHDFVPQEMIQGAIARTGLFSVPVAVLLGAPMYGSCAAVLPIAVALFQKGIPLGTALAFMMATSAISLPEAILLRRAMSLKLVLIFFWIVIVGITITGYLFNFFPTPTTPGVAQVEGSL